MEVVLRNLLFYIFKTVWMNCGDENFYILGDSCSCCCGSGCTGLNAIMMLHITYTVHDMYCSRYDGKFIALFVNNNACYIFSVYGRECSTCHQLVTKEISTPCSVHPDNDSRHRSSPGFDCTGNKTH